MQYSNIKKGIFLARPNRFIAHILVDGREEVCHVKNTGRCAELLIKGVAVFVEEINSPTRKTKFDLISVYKGETLINIDSQAPNKIFGEWLRKSPDFADITFIKPEYTLNQSRLDFYLESDKRKVLVEVKGATLEMDGVVKFPDAPTLRGVKHIQHLTQCVQEGYECYIVFIIQMKGVQYLIPNNQTHPEFGRCLGEAVAQGVTALALDCIVGEDFIVADKEIPIVLDK